jgi:DNA-directed RNA polymerase subunit RPC12/RpoP
MNGNCSDCGEVYELDALDLDLKCADCLEQWTIDLRQEKTNANNARLNRSN